MTASPKRIKDARNFVAIDGGKLAKVVAYETIAFARVGSFSAGQIERRVVRTRKPLLLLG